MVVPLENLYQRGWKDDFDERIKYISKFKNMHRYAHKVAYLELET